LVLAYVAVVVLTVLGGSLLNHSLTSHQHSQIQQLQGDVFYAAEGGLEDVASHFAAAIANFQITPTTPTYPLAGSHLTTFASGATASSVITEVQPGQQTITDPDGTTIFLKTYHVTTTAQHPNSANTLVTLHQMIVRRIIYTFQHAIFYTADLEWLPGPPMTLSGRVHSNSDMYLGANNLLTVDTEYARAAGKIYNRRKDNGTVPPGIVQIKKAGTSPAQYVAMAGLDSDSPTWYNESQTRWNGTVKSDVHGVTQLAVPVVGSTQPGGFYDSQADVKVVNGTVTQGGLALVEGTHIPPGTVTTTTSFYNNREGKWVKMTEVNLKKLAGYADGDPPGSPSYSNRLPTNGLLYATRDDVLSSQQPGIRLHKGQEIVRNGGLTVVSNDPIYIQGDFNTVNKKPVAVIGDAANLLSNSWNDATSNQQLDNRVASNTTVHCAFIAGIVPTQGGTYSGGLENYPRFHEKWTNKTLAIVGSFVSLWNSQIATGAWQYGSPQYTAPIRNWNYDTSFSDGNVPPFTPWAVEIVQGAWWKQ